MFPVAACVTVDECELTETPVVLVCSVWDWEQGSRLSAFSVRNPRHTRITYSEFINAHDQALLVTGCGL